MVQYGRRLLDMAPRWIRNGDGGKVLLALGAHVDRLADGIVYAAATQHPSQLGQNLALIGQDRGISRGPQESAESYAQRLRSWRAEHSRRGTGYGMLNQIRIAMGNNIPFTTLTYRNGARWLLFPTGSIVRGSSSDRANDGPATAWARWWLTVNGTNLDAGVVQTIKTITQEWNAAHCIGYCAILNGDRLWDNPELWDSNRPWDSNNASNSWTVVG
jgi:hypothetical protein